MKKTLFSILSILLIACNIQQPVVEHKRQESTPLNQEFTSEIGATITEYTDAYFVEALKITKGSKVKSTSFSNAVQTGDVFRPGNKVNNTQYYLITSPDNLTARGIAINERNNNAKFVEGNIYNLISYNFETPISYEKIKVPDDTRDYFKKEFLYNGKAGNTIKFSYREFMNSIARPSFTQEVQYDLSESNIIGFKGMRVEVIKATNTTITYRILNPFTQ